MTASIAAAHNDKWTMKTKQAGINRYDGFRLNSQIE